MDHATPNLPSRDFTATADFYARFGFTESWRDSNWMILRRGGVTLEFFRCPELDPAKSWFSCCLRMDDVEALFEDILRSGVPEMTTGWPRLHRPKAAEWGGKIGALIDPDGTLLRLIQDAD
ncbi:MAG: bleomycin resistance protein [Polymorphobacter sp.]|uniref:bleomycin resistance protein n=1 Tax=Polymorphobacter sp. TaxID=1909290 RepID=UPI003A8877EE